MKNFFLVSCLFLAREAVAFKVDVGVLDMQRVILSVEEGKKARETLQKEIQKKEGEIESQKVDLNKWQEALKKEMPLLSEDDKMKKQTEFQEKFMKIRNEEMQLQKSIKEKEVEVTQKIAIKVSQIVQELAKKKELDLVLEMNSSGLMYPQDPVDLTQEVISAYNPKISKK